jgi:hypothetical protein
MLNQKKKDDISPHISGRGNIEGKQKKRLFLAYISEDKIFFPLKTKKFLSSETCGKK